MKRIGAIFMAMLMTVVMLNVGVQASQTGVTPSVWVMINGGYDFLARI